MNKTKKTATLLLTTFLLISIAFSITPSKAAASIALYPNQGDINTNLYLQFTGYRTPEDITAKTQFRLNIYYDNILLTSKDDTIGYLELKFKLSDYPDVNRYPYTETEPTTYTCRS
jgi:hypothetical protein